MRPELSAVQNTQLPARKPGLWKIFVLIALIGGGLILAKYLGLDQRLSHLQPWIASQGAWGPMIFVGVYVGCAIVMLPGSALALTAGALFGSFWGVAWVSLAATLAAGICFLISRYLARDAIAARLKNNAAFQKLESLARHDGALLVATTRLLPIFPFNLLNYSFGLTHVPFKIYLPVTWICMLPGIILYVVSSAKAAEDLAAGHIPWPLMALVAVLLLGRIALGLKAIRKLVQRSGAHSAAESQAHSAADAEIAAESQAKILIDTKSSEPSRAES